MANRGLSLGSCISAAVTVLVDPHRGATFQPVLFGAGQHRPIDRLPVSGRIALMTDTTRRELYQRLALKRGQSSA
jgi:hypothetical protein